MNIFIMRHGDASEVATNDSLRPLTQSGIEEVKICAHWLESQPAKIDLILVSPYVRAQQSADELEQALSYPVERDTLDILIPAGKATQVHDFIDGLLSEQPTINVLLVSHMPLVSYLTAVLTHDHQMPIYPTAGTAQIDYNPELMHGSLVDFLCPEDSPVISQGESSCMQSHKI
ncbi:phosphohistidine phosphatase SixA [Thalassotalea aquiviva]|uniref:phosphohistidine phosphatase SixA n=1 Tax=Thalassotalea aquiviva TaxID=3242415 RepID=UPI003529ED6C